MPDARWAGSLVAFLLGATDADTQLARVRALCAAAQRTARAQPALVRVSAPCKVFGDIHGQLRDVLLLFREFGAPWNRTGDIELCEYVFNGDWVDRGRHQIEVVVLLLALKVWCPWWCVMVCHGVSWYGVMSATRSRSACCCSRSR